MAVSNPDKVLFPDDGVTKAELISYYLRIAPVMLPHVRGRPLTLVRYPKGIRQQGFFQKGVSDYFPGWIGRVEVTKEDGTVIHPLADDAATLAYLANQAAVTLHVWTSRVPRLDYPDVVVFDMDPGAGGFASVRAAARLTRALLTELGLAPYVQTTGSRGLHVVAPLDASAGFEEVRAFARDAADLLASKAPARFTTEVRKAKRADRLFIDTGRNAYAQTFAAPYTVRPRPGAPIAAPIDWAEVGRIQPQSFTIRNVFRRLARKVDPWADIWSQARPLAPARRRLDAMLGADRK